MTNLKDIWILDVTPAEKLILLCLNGFGEKANPSIKYLSWRTGLCKRHIRRLIREMEKKGIIETEIMTGRGNFNRYKLNPEKADTLPPFNDIKSGHLSQEKRTSEPLKADICDNVYNKSRVRIKKEIKKKEKQSTPYSEIIADLNKKANTAFKSSTRKTQESIQARFKEGFKFEDFEIVHTKKCKEWIGTEYAKYLRPITLHGTKFEGYLNQVDMEAEVKEKKRLAEDKHKAEKIKQDEIDDKIKVLRISTNKYLSKISPEDLKKLTREAETRMKTDGIDPESGLFRATINIYIRAIVAERLKLNGDLK